MRGGGLATSCPQPNNFLHFTHFCMIFSPFFLALLPDRNPGSAVDGAATLGGGAFIKSNTW